MKKEKSKNNTNKKHESKRKIDCYWKYLNIFQAFDLTIPLKKVNRSFSKQSRLLVLALLQRIYLKEPKKMYLN